MSTMEEVEPAEAPMSAADVYEALLGRWPPSEYLSIREAPEAPDRQGRKLDLVVVSLWRSRGHELDGVEVKISMSDWRRELKEAAKADFWWRHVNRFWVAVPATIADKVKKELPATWGLLSCTRSASRVIVKPERHDREVMTWQTSIGLLRASADAGVNALLRAQNIGRERGFKEGRARAVSATSDANLKRQLDQLRDCVERFEKASGVKIDRWNGQHIGSAVNLVLKAVQNPAALADFGYNADRLEQLAGQVREVQAALAATIEPGGPGPIPEFETGPTP